MILQMVACASCCRRYLWSRSPFTSCTHLDANFRCVYACSSIFWLKRSVVFLADDAGTTEWRPADPALVDCGERSTTLDMGANRPTAVITEYPLFRMSGRTAERLPRVDFSPAVHNRPTIALGASSSFAAGLSNVGSTPIADLHRGR